MLTDCSGWQPPPIVDLYRLDRYGFPDVPITREHVDSLPYASIYAKVGKGPRSFIVLALYDHEDLHWISADYVAIVTRHGRVVKTAGLRSNLMRTVDLDQDPVTGHTGQFRADSTHQRLIDIMPGEHFGVPVTCRYRVAGNESITIVGKEYTTVKIEEFCKAPLLDWEFENTFWSDIRTGFIWKSIQHVTPGVPAIDIEVLKPAALPAQTGS